jgi:hypothetical protein
MYERDLGVWNASAARGSADELVDGDCDGGMLEVEGTRGVGGVGYAAAPGENKFIN